MRIVFLVAAIVVASSFPARSEMVLTPEGKALCGKVQDVPCRTVILRANDCMLYRSYAYNAFSAKMSGMPEEFVIKSLGQGREDVIHIIVAAYYGNGLYGKTTTEFSDYAFKTCLKGDLF